MTTRRPRRFKKPRSTEFDEHAYAIKTRREIADKLGVWEQCGRWPCYRAKACRMPGVECFDEHRSVIQDCIRDMAVEWYRIAGMSEDLLPQEDW